MSRVTFTGYVQLNPQGGSVTINNGDAIPEWPNRADALDPGKGNLQAGDIFKLTVDNDGETEGVIIQL